ncbi:FCD domain-containing protein [Streptomyces sp. NPDC001536]|uniref:FCD domain-containing protein n=1 Tax=Streptomyces sp. NPDC001536 TaxID=3364583 RepID=UPI0036D12898
MQEDSRWYRGSTASASVLCEQSGNSILVKTWRQLEGPMRVVIMSAAGERRDVTMSAASHAPIADAIARGDATAAQEILHAHMTSAIEHLGIEREGTRETA